MAPVSAVLQLMNQVFPPTVQGPSAADTATSWSSLLYSSLLGVPDLNRAGLTLLGVAVEVRMLETCWGVAVGLADRYIAATPAPA
jgi:hypothetical protein